MLLENKSVQSWDLLSFENLHSKDMGESACLMQPFSYVSGFPNEAKEGNPIHALGQSVSFGRFMSESLSWEKWSTFPHKKYVEEAERYSRPGSVAEKKAFFEAHYKKIAERKAAAALLEEASNASNNAAAESESESGVNNVPTQDSKMTSLASSQQEVKANEHNSIFSEDKSESKKVEGTDLLKEKNVLVEKNVNVISPHQLGNDNNKEDVKETELSGMRQVENYVKADTDRVLVGDKTTQVEKPQFKQNSKPEQDGKVSLSKKKPALSSSKSSSYGRASKVPSSLAKSTALAHSKKENNATPISKKSAVDSADKKRSTPKAIQKSIYFTPAREINRLTSTIIRKIDSSKVGSNSKASKDCSTPLKTPTTASVSGAPRHPFATPWSENKRAGTPHESSVSGKKAVRAKWQFLPTDCSKFLSACRNKSQSPNPSTPFRFRTEERAKRKEKLEEKFNANQAQKAQQQATLKEKAETELRKLRQSLCFKARPLPDFYKERATPKNETKKVPLAQPESPKLGRNSTLSTVQGKSSQLSQRPSAKKISSNHILEKKSHTSRSLVSRTTRITHENTSPNIQHE